MMICNLFEGDITVTKGNSKLKINDGVTQGMVSIKDEKLVIVDESSTLPNVMSYPIQSAVVDEETGVSSIVQVNSIEELPEKGSSIYRTITYRNKKRKKLTYSMVEDTEENPLITVLCNKITFFEGVEAEINYVCLDGGYILACLISGECAFNDIHMQRCVDVDPNHAVSVYNKYRVSTTDGLNSLQGIADRIYYDVYSNYVYASDVICKTIIQYTAISMKAKKSTREDVFISRKALDAKIERENSIKAKEEAKKKEEKLLRDANALKDKQRRIEEGIAKRDEAVAKANKNTVAVSQSEGAKFFQMLAEGNL